MSRRKPFTDLESDSFEEVLTPEVSPETLSEIQKTQREELKESLGGNVRFGPKKDVSEIEEEVVIETSPEPVQEENVDVGRTQQPEPDDDPEGLSELLQDAGPEEKDFNPLDPNAQVPSLEELAIGNMYTLHTFMFSVIDSLLVNSGRVKREGLIEKLERNQEGLTHTYRGVLRKYGDKEIIKRMNDPVMLLGVMSAGMIAAHIAENKQ